jgi:hypothetical protein
VPTAIEFERIARNLSITFQPALASGAEITLNDRALPALGDPSMKDVIRQVITLRPDKSASVVAGMLTEPGLMSDVHLTRRHRVIDVGNFGCGTYSGTEAMFARVVLNGDWRLSPYKDDLSESEPSDREDVETLRSRVLDVLRPLLERCATRAMTAVANEIARRINEELPEELQCVRPPKKKGQRERTEREVVEREQHRPSRDGSPSGPARKRQPQDRRLLIEFRKNLYDEWGVGRVIHGQPTRVQLATDCPYIAQYLARRNRRDVIRALKQLALGMYEHHRRVRPIAGDTPAQIRIDVDEPFGVSLWKLFQQQTDGLPLEPDTGEESSE